MMLAINGIPVIAIELKNQLTGQSVDDGKKQWAYNRNAKEPVFGFNKRILAYFACDLYDVYMTTRLDDPMTNFLPFNQGSNGAGQDGGAGNPENKNGDYVTAYFWENVLQKDNLLDILQKFISYEKPKKGNAAGWFYQYQKGREDHLPALPSIGCGAETGRPCPQERFWT